MSYVFLLGRLIFGGFFLNAGINHFRNAEMMTPYAAAKHVPAPRAAVIGTGVLLVAGGLSVILGVLTSIGLSCIVLFLLFVTPTMHNYWADTDPTMKQLNQTNFQKNVALLGAALALLALGHPWPLAIAS